MPWTSTTPILIWAVIFIPAFILLWIFPPKIRLTALFILLDYAALSIFFVFAVNWAVVNYWLRLVPVILTILLGLRFLRVNRTIHKFQEKIRTPFLPAKKTGPLAVLLVSILLLLGVGYLDYHVLQSTSYASFKGKPILLFYPVRYGMYVVTNGGNGVDGVGMNNLYQDLLGRKTGVTESTTYGISIMKMRDRGGVSNGTLPTTIHDYEGFRDNVYAPCVGRVVYVEDGYTDAVTQTPSDSIGNRVVIQCGEYYVTLANLMNQSILVKVGQEVDFQIQIGQIGSSGAPAIPHLFMYVTSENWDRTGKPVPMLLPVLYSQIFPESAQYHLFARNDIFIP